MTAANILLWLALWLTPTALVFAWIAADTWLACPEDEHPGADVEWMESLSERHDRLDAEAAANVPAYERPGRSANR